MFDWLEYNEQQKAAFKEQSEHLQKFLAEYLKINDHIRDLAISEDIDENTINKIKKMEIPKKGRNSLEVGQELVDDVFKKALLIQHPRFFSFVPSSISPYSLAGAILTDIFNIHAGSYMLAPGAALIEEKLIAWMASLANYPKDSAGGIFVSGGSMANLSALAVARDEKLKDKDFRKGRIYFSNQTHSSNEKGLRILGFKQEQIVKIDTDDNFKIDLVKLKAAIEKDLGEGNYPFCIIGNLGTTNTGTIDPLKEMGEIAKQYNLWFHVDGAYGGSILLSEMYRPMTDGIELTDSFSWDTHKWLMQVYSCSSLIVKDKQKLLNTFTEHPEYLADVSSNEHNDGWDLGPEMSRPHRAIKLWYTLQATGTDLLTELVDYSCYNALLVKKELLKHNNWEIISEPSCGAINFRYHPLNKDEKTLDFINKEISRKLIESGFAYIVTTTLKNKVVLRMCLLNCNTTKEDIVLTIEELDRIAKEFE